MYSFFKRFFDVALSFLLIIVLFPLMAVVAAAIKLESKGSALFLQQRIGRGGKLFNIYKFRSMRVGAENEGTLQYSFEGDPRVTKVGKFIRKTSIDELPQLFNVLKGEMSFIGPRPPLTYHPWLIEEYTPFQLRMFEVRPGITGWAQVNGRKEVEWHERIRLNVWYIDNMSLMFDIKIIFMTLFKVLKNENNQNHGVTVAHHNDENYESADV